MDLIHSSYHPVGEGPHPTVIALHGWGASALDLLGLAPHLANGQLLVLCPQGPIPVATGQASVGYGWFPISMGAPPDPEAFRHAVDALDAFLATCMRHYPITPDRLAVIGFSQGGAMAYALMEATPRRFAAVAALSTWLPPGVLDPTGPAMEPLAGLPVLVQHGASDALVPIARGRAAVDDLRQAGAAVRYREYGMGHEISAESLRDLDAFLAQTLCQTRPVA